MNVTPECLRVDDITAVARGKSTQLRIFMLPSVVSTHVTAKDIARGYFVAASCLCIGYYFGMQVEGSVGTTLVRIFYLLSALVVLKVTFASGRLRGFPVKDDEDRIVISHLLRILVMAVIVCGALFFVTAPFLLLAFKLTR